MLACARVGGIMAIKRTSDIIPMCHPLLITKSKCDIAPIAPAGTPAEDVPEGWAPARAGRAGWLSRTGYGRRDGQDGIEMEALTGASAACLTIYDMCKAVDRGMEIVDVRLLHKEGGRSGVWDRVERQAAAIEAVGAAGNAPAPAPSRRRTRSSDTGRPRDRVYRLPKLGQDHARREGYRRAHFAAACAWVG